MLKFLKINLLAFFIGFGLTIELRHESTKLATLVKKHSAELSIQYTNKIVTILTNKVKHYEHSLRIKIKEFLVVIEKYFIKHQQNISTL